MLIHSAVITGSVQFNNTDVSGITNVSSFATTASVDALVVKTGSFATTSSVNELQSKTGSYTSTSSFGAYTSSNDTTNTTQNTRLSTIESVTGSFASTSSVNNLQSVTGSFATTSSFTSYTSSNDGKVNAVIAKTGSFATTGSNAFTGSQTITGSLTATGTITAQTLVVQTITSSVEYSSGSNIFGSLSTNTHSFTGSVGITGSNAALLNVNNGVLYVSASGNIGIGTTAPSALLHLYKTSYPTLQVDSGTVVGNVGIDTANNVLYVGTTTNHPIVFGTTTAATERMRITASGSVGIGTTNPSGALHIVGTNATNRGQLSIQSNNASNAARVSFYYDTTLQGNIGTTSGDFYGESINNYLFYAGGSERMRITSGGQVGIGATSISSYLGSYTKLSVNGAGVGAVAISGAGALDLGIAIDQYNAGLTLLFLASRNTSNGTSTASAVYIISFYYDGGNFPSITYLGGTSNFVTFGSSGGKLTATNSGSGNASYSWFTTIK
jgi:hypothetical protein